MVKIVGLVKSERLLVSVVRSLTPIIQQVSVPCNIDNRCAQEPFQTSVR